MLPMDLGTSWVYTLKTDDALPNSCKVNGNGPRILAVRWSLTVETMLGSAHMQCF